MEILIHKPEGKLESVNPWAIGKKVRRKAIHCAQIRAGTIGTITSEIMQSPADKDRIRIEWENGECTPTAMYVLELVDGDTDT